MSGRTFLLVPGAGGDAYYWHRVVPPIERAGHRAIAVDLPADDHQAGFEEYAGAIVTAGWGRPDLTVVAQSLGGFSAPLAVDPLSAEALVLLNAMIPRPGESAAEWFEQADRKMPNARSHAARDGPRSSIS